MRFRFVGFLRYTAMSLRVTVNVLRHWPIIAFALVVMSPVGPHIRVDYQYERDGAGYLMQCRYFGSRGFREVVSSECPLISPFMNGGK
jgi:hypothetical protein